MRRRASGLVLLAALVLLSAPYLTAPRAAAAPGPYNVTLLFTSDAAPIQDGVVTDGAVVAWLETDGTVVVHELRDGSERILPGPARRGQLALSGGTLVWAERGAEGAAIRAWRLADDAPFTVAAGPGERNGPAIGGSTVVWRDRRGGAWDLYAYDLTAGREWALAVDAASQGAASVAGGRVVWEEYRDGSWDLRGYDLAERREFEVTAGPDDDLSPVLDAAGQGAGAVAFIRRGAAGGFGALLVRDLGSGQERTIVSGHPVGRPALAGNLVVWEDWRAGAPNIYAYDRETKREFPLARSEQARGPAVAGSTIAWLSKGQFTGRVKAAQLVQPRPTDPQDPPTVSDPDTRYFPETRHTLRGPFRAFWNLNGGLPIFGLPISEAFEEADDQGARRSVQYFERAKLEADPRDPTRVTIARLGAELSRGRDFQAIEPFDDEDRVYLAQTGHSLKGAFRTFWEEHGGTTIFGYPLSEELQEGGTTVQWFERARFELGPEVNGARPVLLSQLGREALAERTSLPGAGRAGQDR